MFESSGMQGAFSYIFINIRNKKQKATEKEVKNRIFIEELGNFRYLNQKATETKRFAEIKFNYGRFCVAFS